MIGQYKKLKNIDRDMELKISKSFYDPNKKEIWINEVLYFCEVSNAVWEYKIGGYQVLDRYLKSHKDENIDYEHFSKMIQALHKSLELEKELSSIELD